MVRMVKTIVDNRYVSAGVGVCWWGTSTRSSSGPRSTSPPPEALMRWAISKACRSFACGTGLGWGALHSRALLLCSDPFMDKILKLLMLCEATCGWPEAVTLIVVVLLPKPHGGFRPIGLLPVLPNASEEGCGHYVGASERAAVCVRWRR